MKKLGLSLFAIGVLVSMTFAGTESFSGKEMKQVAPAPPPCPQWYADNEWNVSLWATYAFTGTDYDRGSPVESVSGSPGTYDRFLGGDHAWGGGGDLKYFFHRYFGVGIEGFGLAAHGSRYVIQDFTPISKESDRHAAGGVLGTLTLRYPIPCTRFSPYVWAGGGGIFGGHNDRHFDAPDGDVIFTRLDAVDRAMGQFGGGMEIRITPHIGWTGDFSWNVVDGSQNNFGMVRTGINFAF